MAGDGLVRTSLGRPLTLAALAVVASLATGCAESTSSAAHRTETGRSAAGTMKQAPPSMGTAQAALGKGRAGEHKSTMHHH
jgi:hypothetical protein